ncbi:cysteine proteinase [Myriangium duriaei CBS 260.36]|uniref:ubiquitinyl hydrolase 1 n=1 Tax=Myriangium duriaei CBS 260.36 TaxID=1168546 RepID=A0A9P4J5B2_9PEZI|nr:cysteine proteinase [Myriangium duriaei CBS 260.36]
MAPRPKKRKVNNDGKTADRAKTSLDRDTWPGWCEFDSDPAFFNVALRELGVVGVKVVEVYDPANRGLIGLPQPVHGVIFCFPCKDNDLGQMETTCPQDMWFANQIPTFNCASVALLNVVNNIPGLELGDHLQSFREFTTDMSPLDRGYAIDSFDFLRKVHNSFSRELDFKVADVVLKRKHANVQAKINAEKRSKAKEAKEAQKAHEAEQNGVRRSTRKRKQAQVIEIEEQDSNEAEEGFHYIAYVPINGRVWSMDGMDSFPREVGVLDEWPSNAMDAINTRMAEYNGTTIAFSVVAVVRDPYTVAKRVLEQLPPQERPASASGNEQEDQPPRNTGFQASVQGVTATNTSHTLVDGESTNDAVHENEEGRTTSEIDGNPATSIVTYASQNNDARDKHSPEGEPEFDVKPEDTPQVGLQHRPPFHLNCHSSDWPEEEEEEEEEEQAEEEEEDVAEAGIAHDNASEASLRQEDASPVNFEQEDAPDAQATRKETPQADISGSIDGWYAVLAHEEELRRVDVNKATLRRHEYRDMLTAWVEALKDQGSLDPLAKHVKDEKL